MTTISADPVFIDTNVLIYASISTSPYYSIAIDHLRSFENVRADQWISRQILREYLAVQTRPIPSKKMLSVKEITADIFSFQSRFLIAEDGPLVTDRLLKLIGSIPIGGKQIHDANIVATMLAHGLRRLLTHNVIDFQRFAGTIDVIPMI
jgi:predicted nucleic acid-binding protein